MSERVALPETDPSEAPRGRRNPAIRRRRAALSVDEASAGMLIRRLSVRAPDVVFVKGVIEASEGLAVVFAETTIARALAQRGFRVILASPSRRVRARAEYTILRAHPEASVSALARHLVRHLRRVQVDIRALE